MVVQAGDQQLMETEGIPVLLALVILQVQPLRKVMMAVLQEA
jgi:hypothetical protein